MPQEIVEPTRKSSTYRMKDSKRQFAVIVCLIFLCFGAGCKKTSERVVLRILLPPSSSAVMKAIVGLEAHPLTTDTGQIIIPARMVTRDVHQYDEFIQDVETSRPQIIIVPTENQLPASLRGENRSATLPCSPDQAPCIAIVAPWVTTAERRAADVVLQRIRGNDSAGRDR